MATVSAAAPAPAPFLLPLLGRTTPGPTSPSATTPTAITAYFYFYY